MLLFYKFFLYKIEIFNIKRKDKAIYMKNNLNYGKQCIGQEVFDCNNNKGIIIDQYTINGKKSVVVIKYEDGTEQIREKFSVKEGKFQKPFYDNIQEHLNSGNWKYIPNFNNRYIMSKLGEIQVAEGRYKGKILVPSTDNNGYLIIVLQPIKGDKSSRILCRVHKLMIQTFIREPLPNEEINHIDGNKKNNSLSNLEIVSKKQNNEKYLNLNDLGFSPQEIEELNELCIKNNITIKELLSLKLKEELNI